MTLSITAVVPTLNSASTLAACLQSLTDQKQPPNEIIVVDGGSHDQTEEIARAYNASFCVPSSPGLLNARRVGAMASSSQVIAMIDSDQVLESFALEASAKALAKDDMVILGEYTMDPKTWVERLFAADKERLHREWTATSDPATGVLLPRVFKSGLLQSAMAAIPNSVVERVVSWDHAIIYFEAWKLSHRIGFVPAAVGHREPSSLGKLVRKWFRWGAEEADATRVFQYREYRRLCMQKIVHRVNLAGFTTDPCVRKTLLLMTLKGIPYWTGFNWQRLRRTFGGA